MWEAHAGAFLPILHNLFPRADTDLTVSAIPGSAGRRNAFLGARCAAKCAKPVV